MLPAIRISVQQMGAEYSGEQRAGPHLQLVADRGMPLHGCSTEWWYLYLIKCHEPTVGYPPPSGANHLRYVYSDRRNPNTTHSRVRQTLHDLALWDIQGRSLSVTVMFFFQFFNTRTSLNTYASITNIIVWSHTHDLTVHNQLLSQDIFGTQRFIVAFHFRFIIVLVFIIIIIELHG